MLRFLQRWQTPRGWLALSLTLNLPLTVWGFYKHAFDTDVHVFFASHYQRNWFELWEPRWYLGFSMVSYPPLVHQLIALIAWPLEFFITRFAPRPEQFAGEYNLLSLEFAYAGLLLVVLCGFPFAVRAWAQIFVGLHAANWAAVLSIFLPALSLTGWAFGQLPTLAATTALLLALARGADFLRTGHWRKLIQAMLLAGACAALHHGVFLSAPFFGLALALVSFLSLKARVDARAWFMRLCLWATLCAFTVAAVLWPFLLWSNGQSLQTPIDHPSRYNFLESWHATAFFFWPVHGPLLLLIPFMVWLTWRRHKLWPLTLAWAALFILSLGGTTPLPKLLFGAGWEWLTYDRFGLWAGIALAPLAGVWMLLNQRQARGTFVASSFFISLALTSLASASVCLLAQCQPPAVNLAPLVKFLNEPEQKPYRYFTLGFGDQLAKLSLLVSNGTPDGTYHTARTLPEFRASGLGALDSALWNPQGVWALEPFLAQPQRYGARWAFVNHAAYMPVLKATGWRYRFDVGAVQAWERADVQPVVIEPPPKNDGAAWWWGSAPLAILVLSGVSLAWRTRFTRKQIISTLTHLRWGLLALTLVLLNFGWLWPVRPALTDYARLYFVYESVLIYASDVTLALALGIWLITLFLQRPTARIPLSLVSLLSLSLLSLFLSATTSVDIGLSLATALHWCLLAGLFIMFIIEPPAPRWLLVIFGASILWQAAWACLQAITQSTAVPTDWPFLWPGFIAVAQAGASVVQNAEGARWLRVYGTLSHPNLLGAMGVVFLGIYLASGSALPTRPPIHRWAEIAKPSTAGWVTANNFIIIFTTIITALTFSRAAWLGLGGMFLALWPLAPNELRPRIKRWAMLIGVTALLTLAPLWNFVFTRLAASQENRLENASTLERTLLIQFGLQAWQASPLVGVGAGGFVQWAAQNAGVDLPFEPVHNVPLLILAETGLVGAGAALAVAGAIVLRIWRRRTVMNLPEAICAATLMGVGITMLFDHLWWTQPPARLLLVMLVGLWVGQTSEVHATAL